jgi:twinfilin-like protein
LIVGIEKEQLVPLKTLSASDSDFLSDLSALQDSLTTEAAAYVILRRYPDAADGYVAVTYVPDTAPVRQKMLFAATRLTLVRELGTEKFRETLFATIKEELTAEGWKKHDQHGELKAPLTQEEETLKGVKDAEAEASRSTGERRQQIHSSGLRSPVSEEGIAALKALPDGENNLVQMVCGWHCLFLDSS